jgi:DNA-binding NarL/FixJ family response regulator
MCQAPRFVLETPLRIVICEDDEQLGALVADILDRDGRFIVVGRALDGDEVVRLVEQESPDVVLMDIGLPGRSGIDATRAIHERDSGQHVVIYTGSDEYEDIGRAAADGAVGYL